MSALVLVCRACGTARDLGSVDYRCAVCGGELVVRVDGSPPASVDGEGIWSRAPWLPGGAGGVHVSLGEGGTPLVPVETRDTEGIAVSVKCEHLNPTGSFKDRIASVAVTLAKQRHVRGLVGTSSGNGGAAAAAYCARAGLDLVLFALADVAEQKLMQIRALGGHVVLVDGLGHDADATEAAANAVANHAASAGYFPFLTGGRYSPEAMEGAKTIAHELADQAGGATAVYVPVGGGGLLSALGRGFAEVARTAGSCPRLVAVQPVGCATLRPALAGDRHGLREPCTTTISGLQVAQLFDAFGAVDAVEGSRGHVVEVADADVFEAQRVLAREAGLLVEPAGATAFAGLLADLRAGAIGKDDRVVVLATGAGYKDSAALSRLGGSGALQRIGPEHIGEVLDARP